MRLLVVALVAATSLGAQTASSAARDSVIRTTALRGFPEGAYVTGFVVRGDTAVVSVTHQSRTRDGFTDVATYEIRLIRSQAVWLRSAPKLTKIATIGLPTPPPGQPKKP